MKERRRAGIEQNGRRERKRKEKNGKRGEKERRD